MVAREPRWGGLFLLHCCWLERRLGRLGPLDPLHPLIGKVFALGHDPIADFDVGGAAALSDLKRSWRLIVDVHRADWISDCGHEHVIVFVVFTVCKKSRSIRTAARPLTSCALP